jgi:hypothetical protein
MFRPLTDTYNVHHYASFRYRFLDPEDASLSSPEGSVHIRVLPVNDAPEGTAVVNVSVTGSAAVMLAGTDSDGPSSDGTDLRFARVSKFPQIGRLFQTSRNGDTGALLDGTVMHVATVVVSSPSFDTVFAHTRNRTPTPCQRRGKITRVSLTHAQEWASEVIRFSSQFSKCSNCFIWSGAESTGCNQASTGSKSTCRGASCSVPFGSALIWGDGSCQDYAWNAKHILGSNDFYPGYGDNQLAYSAVSCLSRLLLRFVAHFVRIITFSLHLWVHRPTKAAVENSSS